MTVRFTNLNDDSTEELQLVQGRPVPLPGDAGSVSLMEFAENLMNAGRAARLLVRPTGGQAYAEWAFEKRPDFMPPPKGGLQFELIDYKARYWTGLQVSRDPGVPLIWIASGVMFLGFIMAFFFAHQKLYMGVIEKKNGLQIVLAGSSHRTQAVFR